MKSFMEVTDIYTGDNVLISVEDIVTIHSSVDIGPDGYGGTRKATKITTNSNTVFVIEAYDQIWTKLKSIVERQQ